MSDHETTLRELAAGLLARGRIDAEEPSSASQRADIIRKSERNADACLAGADALRRIDAARAYIELLESCQDGYYRATESPEAKEWEVLKAPHGAHAMTRDEAIAAIDANWPTENYTMLREALTLAKDALRPATEDEGDKAKHMRDSQPRFSQYQMDAATKPLHAEIERLRSRPAPPDDLVTKLRQRAQELALYAFREHGDDATLYNALADMGGVSPDGKGWLSTLDVGMTESLAAPAPVAAPEVCSTCGASTPDDNLFCSNGFHKSAAHNTVAALAPETPAPTEPTR